MGTEVDGAVLKRTQSSLGKFVKRPALTEKLLRKPPFRFLHDVVHAIVREHGLLEGLYTADELNSDNIKDRDSKMAFLQKLIDVVKLLTDRDLKVRPSKVVAGLEVERTNELLQALGYALEQKLSSADIVRQYLAVSGPETLASKNPTVANGTGASESQQARKEPAKDRSKDKEPAGVDKRKDRSSKPKEKEAARNGISAVAVDVKASDGKGKSKVQNGGVKVSNDPKRKVDKPAKGKDKERSLKRIPSIPEEQQPVPPQTPTVKDRPSHDVAPNSAGNGVETLTNGKQSNERRKRRDSYKESVELGPAPQEDEAKGGSLTMEEENERHRKQNGTGSNSSSRRSSLKKQNSLTPSENNALSEMNQFNGLENSPGPSRQDSGTGVDPPPAIGTARPAPDTIEIATMPEQMAAGGGNTVTTVDPLIAAPESNSRGVVTGKPPMHRQQSVETVLRPRTSLRPPSVRPPSARPGAPRRKEKNVEVILQPNEMQKLGDINVKMEVFNSELLDDDGENLIVIEDPISTVDDVYGGIGGVGAIGSAGMTDGDELSTQHLGQQGQGQEEHQGHLVQQILETQKEFSNHANHDGELLRKPQDTDWSIGQRQSSVKQMELLRESIQKLTRSVNPLGKLMDFIQEDVDSMERELANWQQIYSRSIVELNKERSATENAIEPLKHQLSQIEVSIKEYREMIDSTRATILQNEQKIERLYMTEL
ncbi:TRAF3-interacting protein 1 [Anopheles darlingi]|uniref:TRAF3-interacting protein 1 n=1 Tax=Anopheles darlingi TaxID=43151 RepID=UPI00210059BF|nr:TRAF3-interacting protein 1 [Anopheles darlingi]